MRTRVKLRPGQRGTKQWVAKYGDRLVCVRYRYDAQHHKRYTTVEVIVAEGPWTPPPPAPDAIVGVRVAWGEAAPARQIKAAVSGIGSSRCGRSATIRWWRLGWLTESSPPRYNDNSSCVSTIGC